MNKDIADDKGCIILIDRPDMTEELVALIGFLIGLGAALTLSPYPALDKAILMTMILILTQIINILSGQALYDYVIWAKPLGQVRQGYSATANDPVLQTMVNGIVQKQITDPLCYSPADCQFVADFELLLCQLQRNRITLEKIADSGMRKGIQFL